MQQRERRLVVIVAIGICLAALAMFAMLKMGVADITSLSLEYDRTP